VFFIYEDNMFKKFFYLASAAVLTSLFMGSTSHAMMNPDTDSNCIDNYYSLKILSNLQEEGSKEHKEYLEKLDEEFQKERKEELKKYRTSSKHLELINNVRSGNLGTGVRVIVFDNFAKPESSEDFLANSRLAGKVPLEARDEAKKASIETCRMGNHGLHVAGLIADDDFGVAPKVQIIPKRALGEDKGYEPLSVSFREIYKNDFGAKIINISLKLHSIDADAIELLKLLCENHLVVWAAGNDSDCVSFTYQLEQMLETDENIRKHFFLVSNVDSDGKKLHITSNRFRLNMEKRNSFVQAVGIAAPGTAIVSTIAEKGPKQFDEMTGTSQATPLVSGLLARLMSDYPEASLTQIANLVRQGTNREGPFSNPEEFGQGMIDVQNTYKLANKFFSF